MEEKIYIWKFIPGSYVTHTNIAIFISTIQTFMEELFSSFESWSDSADLLHLMLQYNLLISTWYI